MYTSDTCSSGFRRSLATALENWADVSELTNSEKKQKDLFIQVSI